MKHKMLAFILALTVASWAQTTTQTTPAATQQNTAPTQKAKCSCCDKMAASSSRDAHSCCKRHQTTDAKETASCCGGNDAKSCCAEKDAKSCMKNGKTASSCCKGCDTDKMAASCGEKCGEQCKNGCCRQKKVEAAAHRGGDDLSTEVGLSQGYSSSGK